MILGKGGAGKTTVAAATAIAIARAGEPVLLVSVDQAHSLTDVLDISASVGVGSVHDLLDVLEIDSLALLEQRYSMLASMASLAGGHEHSERFELPAPEELTGLPGVQELLALSEVAQLADTGRWATVVVDAPASADALRTLTAPRMVADYLERVWPQHSRVETVTGPDPRAAVVVALFDRMLSGIGAVRDLLDDRRRTDAVLVATPDRAGQAELRRLRSWIAMAGVRLGSVVVNGMVPALEGDGDAGRWLAAQRAAHLRAFDDISDTITEAPVIACERRASEPVGLAALEEFANALCADHRYGPGTSKDGDEPVRVQHESGTGVDAVYTMRMYLPLADPRSLTLGRAADDLVVGADGMRRRVGLASVLRRCTVSEAEFDGTDLVVRFAPDPAVWPQ